MEGHPKEIPKGPKDGISVRDSQPIHWGMTQTAFPTAPQVRGELGHFIPMDTPAREESQEQCLTLKCLTRPAATPIPREPDSKNKKTITITQTSGETRRNAVMV